MNKHIPVYLSKPVMVGMQQRYFEINVCAHRYICLKIYYTFPLLHKHSSRVRDYRFGYGGKYSSERNCSKNRTAINE